MPARLKTGGALAFVACAVISGCGNGGSAELAGLAPPDAPLYAEFVVKPDEEQAATIDSFAERVGGIDDPAAPLVAGLDEMLAENGVDASYADDIEPWLGDTGSFFVRSFEPTAVADGAPDFAFMVETEDADAARSFLESAAESDPAPEEERSYRGFDYLLSPEDETAAGIIDGVLVIATATSFKVAVDASEDESLAESEDFSSRTEALADGRLATLFLEPGTAIEAAIEAEDLDRETTQLLRPLIGGPLLDPLAIGLTATPDTATLDFASMVEDDEAIATDPSLIEQLPGGSWLALGVPDLGGALERTLDQLARGGLPGGESLPQAIREAIGVDLRGAGLNWLGDAAAFVEGTGVPGFTAGLVAETTDPDGPRALLGRLRASAERRSGLRSSGSPPGSRHGFSLGLPGLGGGAEAGVVGTRLVAVVGGTIAGALEPATPLGEDPSYQAAVAALGESFGAGLFVHLPSLFAVAEQGGSTADPDYLAAKPYLEAFESLAAGARIADRLALTRVTVSLAD